MMRMKQLHINVLNHWTASRFCPNVPLMWAWLSAQFKVDLEHLHEINAQDKYSSTIQYIKTNYINNTSFSKSKASLSPQTIVMFKDFKGRTKDLTDVSFIIQPKVGR